VRRWAVVLLVGAALVPSTVLGGHSGPLEPGDRLGKMRLVKGTQATADFKLFEICDPVVVRTGRQTRPCGFVPWARRTFIGYGSFALPTEIDKVWASAGWAAWLDGRRIRLPAFGWSERTLVGFPPAGGRDVTLREWRVMLVGPRLGRHTLRYRARDPAGTIDVTWYFTVRRR
jgi:hypothetical protein